MDLSWMAWTQFTAIFFLTIAGLIALMIAWEALSPGGSPRVGALGLTTTRGDRLFLSLLLSAFLALAWLALVPLPLWWVLPLCLLISVLIFCFF
jgi:predicted small integral membrane protein